MLQSFSPGSPCLSAPRPCELELGPPVFLPGPQAWCWAHGGSGELAVIQGPGEVADVQTCTADFCGPCPCGPLRTQLKSLPSSSGELPSPGGLLSLPTRSCPIGQVVLLPHLECARCLPGLRLNIPHSPAQVTFLVTGIPEAGVGRDPGGLLGQWFMISFGAQFPLRT